MSLQILAPAAILALWSLIMLAWLAVTRLPGMQKAGVTLSNAAPGGRGVDLEPVLPQRTNWISHNYTHLMEQPTIFYAVVIILALTGHGTGLNLQMAWAYVVLRIMHSLWQALVNNTPIRFFIFLLSTVCLLIMAVNAVWATLTL
ncbi:MAG: MAPEG family protein [Sphingomonadales bacterium]|nr:MAPEG family protein [Sphingomonadales bacterium]